MSSIPIGGFMPQQQQQKQVMPPMTQRPPSGGFGQPQTFPPSGGFGQPPMGGFGGQQQGGQQMRPGQNGNPSMADEIKSLQGLGGDAHKQQVQHIQSLLGQYNGQQQRPYMQQLAQQLGGQPPMGQGGMDMDKRPGQPMQGGFNPYQQLSQLAGSLGGGGGQFGGQPMQGGFNPQQMGIQQMLNTVPQQAGQQFGGQQLGGQPIQGGQPMSQMQQQLGQLTPQQMQLMSFPQPGQGGQFGGQPMQGGAQAPMSPLRQDPNADDPQRQPRMQNMQNMQQQGSQRGQTMPQAPTTQQMGQENPRMQAMRNMQQMNFGAR